MKLNTGKYSYLAVLDIDELETVSKHGGVKAIRGAATYYLNQRNGKHKAASPAQKRARKLGQAMFFLYSLRSNSVQLRNLLISIDDTDIPKPFISLARDAAKDISLAIGKEIAIIEGTNKMLRAKKEVVRDYELD